MNCPECGRELKEGGKCYFCGNKMIGPRIAFLWYMPAAVFFAVMLVIRKGLAFTLIDYISTGAVLVTGIVLYISGNKVR